MYKFYYPNGDECESVDAFITFYSRSYYASNSISAEKKAIELLEKQGNGGILTEEDLFFILAWKSGGIIHEKYRSISENEYKKGWDKEGDSYKINQKVIDIKGIKDQIDKQQKNSSLKAYLDALSNVDGLGNTYITALAYFATGGEILIYDRFVDRARVAILNQYRPDSKCVIEGAELSNIMGVCSKTCIKRHEQYMKDMYKIFEDRYKERSVDQAMWSYGHLFGVK